MCKPESRQENDTHKILRDFEVQTDPPIPDTRPDVVMINKGKRNYQVDFVVPEDNRLKID